MRLTQGRGNSCVTSPRVPPAGLVNELAEHALVLVTNRPMLASSVGRWKPKQVERTERSWYGCGQGARQVTVGGKRPANS